MKIDELIKQLQNFQETHGYIDVYVTAYECGEELKYKVENLFLDITKNDEYVVVIT
jgi:hypothetical protein